MKKAKFTLLLLLLHAAQTQAQTITDINGPAGSGQFGQTITVLPNGNYVVTDPLYDEGATPDVGAVYLYNGRTRNLISSLKGSTAGDRIGSSGITILANGNYLVHSPNWDNGSEIDAGALTWCSRTKGLAGGIVSSSNSLVGSTAGDQVGGGIVALSNGNYVVGSPNWDNGSATDAGAATWGNGTTGLVGIISSTNSLVGGSTRDKVGTNVRALSNGNYIVLSRDWNNGSFLTAPAFGAVTWGNGTTGITGVVSSANSLVGSSQIDRVGSGVMILSNGNYLVITPFWNDLVTGNGNAGAVTWGSGTTGVVGIISSSNSLIGSSGGESLGNPLSDSHVTLLSNGNYVVSSSRWGNGAGAVTWGSGTTGISGFASSSNSLVGSTANDRVGSGHVTALSNGNYVVGSQDWDNGAAIDAGAVTWGSGTTGVVGFVSSSNSLVGSQINDQVGLGGITALKNGNYVVRSIFWDNGAATDAAAITWGNGATGISGVINSGNSLIGNSAGDLLGNGGMTVLNNGNYVISSPDWDNGATLNAGAVTWGNGTTGISGVVSSGNSLVGSTANDRVGGGYNWGGQGGGNGIVTLNNGNYLVRSSNWNNGAASDAGAVTWGNGSIGISGAVSSSNSLVGALAGDRIGSKGVTALTNGNYVVSSPFWNKEIAGGNHGAVTWGNGTTGKTGIVSNTNSLVGNSGQELVGNGGVTALPNGNYVVVSLNYGMSPNSGAVTWGNGTTGVVGGVSTINSLLGRASNDQAGSGGITVLNNGNYVVHTPNWDHENTITDAGAVTWCNGTTPLTGVISSSNSLVGNSTGDRIGNGGITALSDGNFAVKSPNFDNAATTDVGALTLVNGAEGIDDIITRCNSVIGNTSFGGASLSFAYNDTYDYLIGGRPLDNIVSTNNLRGRARPLAITLDNSITTITGFITNQLIASAGCRIIARHRPNGLNPIRGTLSAKVWIEDAVPSQSGQPFVSRHYEIIPDANASTTTGRITLYFTQTEFDNFNADAASIADLPTCENDDEGKANLRIIKYAGTSSNGSGLPAGYSGAVETINPNDRDINWNDDQNRWEVSFNVIGFGRFIVQTAIDAITSRQQPSLENSKLALYPNPAINAVTLSIGNKNLLNTMAVLTDMQGKLVKQFVINNYMEQIDLSKLPKGMYILKLADGKAMKLTKN
jgi:Repeat of unknown function (DUF5650)/Secretion system C-terminal sorting domain